MKLTTKRVLAIDPGMTTGWAVVEHRNGDKVLLGSGTLHPPVGRPLRVRLEELGSDIRLILAEYQPQVILMEALNLAFDRKSKEGRVVNRKSLQKYSTCWGYLMGVISLWGVPVHFVPLTAPKKKMATRIVKQLFPGVKGTSHSRESIVWAANWR